MTTKRKKRRSTKKTRPKGSGSKTQKRKTAIFEQLVHLSGIPAQSIREELKSIVDEKNLDMESLTIEQLRQVVAIYLRKIMGGLLDRAQSWRHDA